MTVEGVVIAVICILALALLVLASFTAGWFCCIYAHGFGDKNEPQV